MADSKTDKAKKAAGSIGLVTPHTGAAAPPAPAPDEVWELPHGTARVYYGEGGTKGVVRPVVLADGFNLGPSDFDQLWDGLEGGQFPFVSRLRARGRTLILVGFDERSDSIFTNAETVTAAILRTIAEQVGDTRLLVGGFSMGGLAARYALAKLEYQRVDHRTGVYLSFDSPHRGAWVPIGLQAFSHYLAKTDDTYLRQISSPAAQQMLWRHLDSLGDTPAESPLRTEFTEQLRRVGWWPRIPLLLGVSSGRGDGVGNGVRAGDKTLSCAGPLFDGTYFLAQPQGDPAEVSVLNGVLGGPHTITTPGFPELDGAPGGTLESFGVIGDVLSGIGESVDMTHRAVCFVPSVSAVAVRGLDQHDDLYVTIDDLPPDESELDEFILSSNNDPHAAMTPEIGEWVIDRLPD